MTRDELLLAALAEGATTTAELMRSTGVKERSCRYGLRHLIAVGYVWSPERGRWRLTEAGRAIVSTLQSLSAAERPDAKSIAVPVGEVGMAEEPAELPSSSDDLPSMPPSLWWALAGAIAAVVFALARRSTTSLPQPPPAAPPEVWPYDGWRIWGS